MVQILKGACAEIGLPFDNHSTAFSLMDGMMRGHYVTVAEEGDKVKGLAAAAIIPYFTDRSKRRMVEAAWHTDVSLEPLTRARLMIELERDMMEYAANNGLPLFLCPNMTEGLNHLSKHLEKHGYQLKEAIYWKPTGDK
jgi:hypothetical protein